MTLKTLLLDCYRRLHFTATPNDRVTVRLTAFLNDAQRRLLTMPGMELLRDDTITFQTRAGLARYTLPPHLSQVKAIVQVPVAPLLPGFLDFPHQPPLVEPLPVAPTLGTRRLRELRRDDYRRWIDQTPTAQGTPEWYVPMGQQVVAVQPDARTPLFVTSTAADIGPRVFVEGLTTGGYEHVTSSVGTALNGTTRVQCGTAINIITVTAFNLATPCSGVISLWTDAVAGVELARIEPGKTASRYFAIELYPVPSEALVYRVDHARALVDLLEETDEPWLPEDFHYVLGVMACRREMLFNDDKVRYAQLAMEEAEAVRAVRAWVLYPPDYRVVNTDPEATGYREGSNLGGFFPTGRW